MLGHLHHQADVGPGAGTDRIGLVVEDHGDGLAARRIDPNKTLSQGDDPTIRVRGDLLHEIGEGDETYARRDPKGLVQEEPIPHGPPDPDAVGANPVGGAGGEEAKTLAGAEFEFHGYSRRRGA